MNYLDLFSGIGGFALGISRAIDTKKKEERIRKENAEGIRKRENGLDDEGDSRLGSSKTKNEQYIIGSSDRQFNCFSRHYFSEIDKYAISIYKRHFPEAIPVGDISKVKGADLGKINLITFGFPCQDLSIAGKRAGLGGSRSGLFFEAVRLIRELRPSIFIFENVKGLLTSNRGQDFETVLREIADIGLYECEWQLLNTSWFLPQNRERIYFIGHLGNGSGRKVFPIGEINSEGNGELGGGRPTLQARDYKDIGNQPMGLVETTMIHGGVLRKGEYGNGLKDEKSFTMDGTCGRDLLVCRKSK